MPGEPLKPAPSPAPNTPTEAPQLCRLPDSLNQAARIPGVKPYRSAPRSPPESSSGLWTNVVQEGCRFVVGNSILIEECEGVDLADGKLEAVRRRITTSPRRDIELVVQLRQDGKTGVGNGRECKTVDGARVRGAGGHSGPLAESDMTEKASGAFTDTRQREQPGKVAAVGGPSLPPATVRPAGVRPLQHCCHAAFEYGAG